MTVYNFLVENGFIVKSSQYDYQVLNCKNDLFLLDFLNSEGFQVLDFQNRLGLDNSLIYEYGCDSYSGRIKVVILKDITNRINLKFECKKPEK